MAVLNRRTDLGRREDLSRSVRRALQQQARDTGDIGGAGAPAGSSPLTPAAKALVFVTVITTSHSMGVEDVLLVDDDTAGGVVTINLQAVADTFGYSRVIKKLGTTGNVIIDGSGTEKIDGALTLVLTAADEVVTIISDGTEWRVI